MATLKDFGCRSNLTLAELPTGRGAGEGKHPLASGLSLLAPEATAPFWQLRALEPSCCGGGGGAW